MTLSPGSQATSMLKNANALLTLAKTCLNITVMLQNSHHKK
jgi:hypothetical protein